MSSTEGKVGSEITGLPNAQEFLEVVGDEDLLRFLRRLPMVAGHDESEVTLTDLTYEMRLWPFVKSAWSQVEGSPGIAGRILQLSRVYKKAETEMERMTGERRRVPRVIDLPTFMHIYTTDGLP
ncbi:MAG: hypothetical protein AAGB13_15980 [Cyanobacteria bacterium P01_F01_bin.33]